MACVLHRTTLQYLCSVNTPDYSVVNWIINPDMSGVGSDPTTWVVEVDAVREMTAAEQDANIIDAVKAAKIGAIDSRTDVLISAGFTYASKVFSLSLASQSKMMGTHQIKDDVNLTYPLKWNTIDDLDAHELANAAALDGFYLTGVGTMRTHVDGGTTLKDSVRAAATVAAVNAITDTR